MRKLICCIRKDRLEYIRSHKNLLCVGVLLLRAVMILATTATLPILLKKAMQKGTIFSKDASITEFMNRFFPSDIKGSMGILASDIGVFYGLLVIFIAYNLMPEELQNGKIILPLCAGYSRKYIFLSKLIVYGGMMAFPVFPVYTLYYLIGSTFLVDNFSLSSAIISGLIMAFGIFSLINFTITLSVIFNKKIVPLAFMAGVILVVPDALSFFSFGKYLPTYLFTFMYQGNTNYQEVIIPVFTMILLLMILDLYGLFSKKKISTGGREE